MAILYSFNSDCFRFTYRRFFMTPYFTAITCINIFSLIILFVLISGNSVINVYQKQRFQITSAMVFAICVMEVLTIVLDKSPLEFRFLHIASNFIGFSLTPLVFISLAKTLFPHTSRFSLTFSPVVVLWIFYEVWFLGTLLFAPKLSVFYVNRANCYSRATGFVVYVIFYALGLLYFLVKNIFFSARFWKSRGIVLVLNFFLIFFGTTVQIIYPEIQITWITVIFSLLIYFIYHIGLYQQLDMQTCLLNYSSFQNWASRQKKERCIVVAEIDNFAKLKQNYSRKDVDRIVVTVSKIFNGFFKKYGQCYRISGSEFLVTVNDTSLDFDALNKKFFVEFVKESFNLKEIPLVSLGYARISAKSDLSKCLSLADVKKREFARKRPEFLF
ncbi:diguanylate cyclase [Treponema berlinense]|uniref:GGDEF domain-containing protein n=1 Tax=Treponema berlinense TaxID=225004 RepID=UPI0026ECF478|nr:diguanylate cyclase [Treponema berlinense]